jgi:large subunit ribosomal protein L47
MSDQSRTGRASNQLSAPQHWRSSAYSSRSTIDTQTTEAMATIHNRILRPSLASTKTSEFLLAFLVPAAQCTRNSPAARFSTSPIRCKKDNNTHRGLSAVRRTGLRPRQTLSVKQKDFENQKLPKPVPIEEKITGTPDHGLWDFFKDQQLLQTPVEEQRHGT